MVSGLEGLEGLEGLKGFGGFERFGGFGGFGRFGGFGKFWKLWKVWGLRSGVFKFKNTWLGFLCGHVTEPARKYLLHADTELHFSAMQLAMGGHAPPRTTVRGQIHHPILKGWAGGISKRNSPAAGISAATPQTRQP